MEGIKHDEGKPRLSLLPASYWPEGSLPNKIALWYFEGYDLPSVPEHDLFPVLEFGAKKYTAHNWRKGMSWTRLVDAALRHATKYNGVTKKYEVMDLFEPDEESGLPHGAHAACCLAFLKEYELFGIGKDDRPKSV